VKLGTLKTKDGPRPVALRDGKLVELAQPLAELLANGRGAISRAIDKATITHPFEASRLGPAPGRPGKVMCIGRNYAAHAAELGNETPTQPEVFLRTNTSLAGPFDDLVRPSVSEQMDFEVELAVIIGKGGHHIEAGQALLHVGGYCVFNDVSIRNFQFGGTQWTPGKNFDGTGPLGPFIVTADEIPDPQALELSTTIINRDGKTEEMQRSTTDLMTFNVRDLIVFLSSWTTLEPGDVIATGTPSGVGMGRSPQRWLVPGETVKCVVEKVGEISNRVVSDTTDSA
jgi:acylpyruvate hydrolase